MDEVRAVNLGLRLGPPYLMEVRIHFKTAPHTSQRTLNSLAENMLIATVLFTKSRTSSIWRAKFVLVKFYDLSTIVGYLMPNLLFKYLLNI